MQNVDMMGYCYEREKLGSVKTNYFLRVVTVGAIALFAAVVLYGNQKTVTESPTISCNDEIIIKTASVTSLTKFDANGKKYVRIKTDISGDREFIMTLKKYRSLFGKSKKAKCRVHKMHLTSDFGNLRVLKSTWNKIKNSKEYDSLSDTTLKTGALAKGDKYSVTFGDPKEALLIYYNVPITSELTATTYSFDTVSSEDIDSDASDIASLRIRMHGKNNTVYSIVSEF